MRTTRRKIDAALKAKIALEAIRRFGAKPDKKIVDRQAASPS